MLSRPVALHLFPKPVAITGAGAACCLGDTLKECLTAIKLQKSGLRPLGESPLHFPQGLENLLAGWIPDRAYLKGRRYGAASNAAIHAAREAIAAAGWDAAECNDAWLWLGTSRGNSGELTHAWNTRRPVGKFAASNTMHSEPAAAVSLQLGIHGPWQVLANGCAAGLDALGHAALAVAMGWTPRALVVGVDLPLIPSLLENFAATGLLSTNGVNDPYSAETSGFFPAEGVAAVTLEASGSGRKEWCELTAYAANSDAYDAIGLPPDGKPLAELMRALAGTLATGPHLAALCPHATGTAAHRVSESAALAACFSKGANPHTLHLLKPYTGHTLGASGLLDVAILAGKLRKKKLLPANLPGLCVPSLYKVSLHGMRLPEEAVAMPEGAAVMKVAAGMGGHNAGIVMTASV